MPICFGSSSRKFSMLIVVWSISNLSAIFFAVSVSLLLSENFTDIAWIFFSEKWCFSNVVSKVESIPELNEVQIFSCLWSSLSKTSWIVFSTKSTWFTSGFIFASLKSNFGWFELEFGSYRRVRIHFKLNGSSGRLIKIRPQWCDIFSHCFIIWASC